MSFMEPQIEFGDWIEVDGNAGTEVIPGDLVSLPNYDDFADQDDQDGAWLDAAFAACKDYVESSRAFTISVREGWGARLSAPGYMDCTSWGVYDTEAEAREALADMYGDDEDSDEDEDEDSDEDSE